MLSFLGLVARVLLVSASGAGVGIGVLLQLGRWSDRLDVINQFAPWLLLAAGLIGLSSGAVLRGGWRRAAMTLAAAGAVLCGVQVVPELAAGWLEPRGAKAGPTLKIVQFNVWHRNRMPQETLDWILAQDADIVLVQEAAARSQPIADGLREAYPYFASCRKQPCGEAVFSRLPLVGRKGRVWGPLGHWGEFRWRDRTLTVASVHFSWPYPSGSQQRQARSLARFVRARPTRDVILGGDFNSAPWSFSLRRQDAAYGLRRRTRGVFTWPARTAHIGDRGPEFAPARLRSPVPFLAIDQVYAGEGWRTVSVRRGPKLGSDHYPLVVELTPVSP